MIRKFRNKGMLAAVAVVVLMCGCGDGKTGNDRDAEVLNAVENIPVQEEASKEGDRTDQENIPAQENAIGQEEIPAKEDIPAQTGKETGEGEADTEVSIIWDDPTGEGIKTIYGSIRKLEADSFAIEQAMTGTLENGKGDIMVTEASGNEEEDSLVTVKYGDDTEIIVSTTTDGGMTSTQREGNSGELQMDSSLEITGSWEGEIFQANQIKIFISQ